MKKCVLLILAITLMLFVTGCQCRHQWNEATCTEPKTCAKCGETEGEPLGHDFSPANCTEPKTCTRCGDITGSPTGHIWADATTVSPKTCVICGAKAGTCPIDGTWRRALDVGYWQYVINTSDGEYTISQVGKDYSDILGTYKCSKYSENAISGGEYILTLQDANTLVVSSADGASAAKTYTRFSDSTTATEYDNTDTSEPHNSSKNSDAEAFSIACEIVSASLKSPSTASFCKITDATIYDLGNGKYCVKGWVDAQNSFGASLRSDFLVTYTATEKGYKDGSAIIN